MKIIFFILFSLKLNAQKSFSYDFVKINRKVIDTDNEFILHTKNKWFYITTPEKIEVLKDTLIDGVKYKLGGNLKFAQFFEFGRYKFQFLKDLLYMKFKKGKTTITIKQFSLNSKDSTRPFDILTYDPTNKAPDFYFKSQYFSDTTIITKSIGSSMCYKFRCIYEKEFYVHGIVNYISIDKKSLLPVAFEKHFTRNESKFYYVLH